MLKNYLKTLVRNIVRNKTNTFINVLGLSLGISCSIILFLFSFHLLSYNKYEENGDRIFRVISQGDDGPGGTTDYTPGVPGTFADAFEADFPEVEKVIMMSDKYGSSLVTINADSDNPTYYEEKSRIVYAENDFFNIFTRSILEGNRNTPLEKPNKVVLSKKVASKYFPDGNALGQVIVFDRETDFEVVAIIDDAPDNTDFPFDIFLSYATVEEGKIANGWGSISSSDQCYVLLANPEQQESINEGLKAFVTKHFGEDNGNKVCTLQPMESLHFDDNYSNYSYSSMTKGSIYIMLLISAFLIITACINFINLSTAIAVKRAREVGVRKVLGGTKWQLVFQFLGETTVITFFSILIALGLAELGLIYFNDFMETNIAMNLLGNLSLQLYLVVLLVLVSVLAGIYPSFVLSSFKPAAVMKGVGVSGSGKYSLRKSLVIFQFFISQLFVICTIVLMNQMKLMSDRDLGFISDAVLYVPMPDDDQTRKKSLKTSLQSLSGIDKVSLAYSNPLSGSVSVTNVKFDDQPDDFRTTVKLADENYVDVFSLKLIAGKNLAPSDTMKGVLLTKQWLDMTGAEDAQSMIGKRVKIWGRFLPVVGILDDFSSISLSDKDSPLLLSSNLNACRLAAIKMASSDVQGTLEGIEKEWKRIYPEYEYDFTFMDDHVADFYAEEKEMSTILTVFSAVAIFIGCLGLFGLASFMVNRKTKEMGVRKVLGASVSQIWSLFSLEFVKLIIIAFIFSAPLAWWAMDSWLQEYEYRVTIGPVVFVAAIVATFIIALLTTGYKTSRAALANPVDSLRDE